MQSPAANKPARLVLQPLSTTTCPFSVCKPPTSAEGIKSVSGLGLMLGVELERDVNEVLADCFQMGVLPIKAKNKLRLLPALNIPMELLERAVAVIKAAAKGERI